MATATATRPTVEPIPEVRHVTIRDPGYSAFVLMRFGFGLLPIVAGVDKFFDRMVDWDRYLWSGLPDLLDVSAQRVMYAVGAIEIVAGLLVWFAPRLGSTLVALWLCGTVANLAIVGYNDGEYWDIALRDFGLMLGAWSLVMLASKYRARVVETGRGAGATR